MTTLGIFLIGVAIGRVFGDVLWWIDMLQIIVGLGFIVLGQLIHIQRIEAARMILFGPIDNPTHTQADLDEWHERGKKAQEEKRKDKDE